MTPLGFEVKKLFHFISVRFKQTTPKVMEQALNWLQVQKLIFFLEALQSNSGHITQNQNIQAVANQTLYFSLVLIAVKF